ncbi:hypothetical protein ACWF9G_04900 [Nocardia sp. NPDC055029]
MNLLDRDCLLDGVNEAGLYFGALYRHRLDLVRRRDPVVLTDLVPVSIWEDRGRGSTTEPLLVRADRGALVR